MGTVCEVKGGYGTDSGKSQADSEIIPASKNVTIPVTRPLVKSGNYAFPVASPFHFKDTWKEARIGHVHKGVDIFATELTQAYAITDGEIMLLANWKGAGLTIRLKGSDGRGYEYMHLHDFERSLMAKFKLTGDFYDQPNLKNIKRGYYKVKMGSLIGFVGSSGIGKCAPHLHFQVFPNHKFVLDERINFYTFLVELCTGIKDTVVKSVTSYVF
jgi:murein DD-endopeptidase MepM/ murein hydrolase activator NlpD